MVELIVIDLLTVTFTDIASSIITCAIVAIADIGTVNNLDFVKMVVNIALVYLFLQISMNVLYMRYRMIIFP